jgi:hypothetical protein
LELSHEGNCHHTLAQSPVTPVDSIGQAHR